MISVGQRCTYKGFHCIVIDIVKDSCEIKAAMGNQVVPLKDVRPFKTYILCAAIHYKDGKKHNYQPSNIDTGYVICGRRHNNCIVNTHEDIDTVQGFVTSDDRFLNRIDSATIAYDADQLGGRTTEYLFSEDLY